MWYILSFVLLVACVKLLSAGVSPVATAGIFAVGKVLGALILGGGVSGILLTGGIAAVVGFGYFWLLDRFEGSGMWWIILIGGVFLLA